MIWMYEAVRGCLISPKNGDCRLEISEARFGQSRIDLGLKMVPVCFTCVLYCGFGCCWAGNGHGFQFQRSGTEVDEGGYPWTAHVLFLGAVKNSPGLLDWA